MLIKRNSKDQGQYQNDKLDFEVKDIIAIIYHIKNKVSYGDNATLRFKQFSRLYFKN